MITMKNFVTEEDPILRQVAEPVTFPLSAEDLALVEEMRQFLINSQTPKIAEEYGLRPGVGLAAPQIGVSKQIFAVYLTEYDDEGNVIEAYIDEVFINPRILKHSVKKAALSDGEGCLSVPRSVPGLVARPKRVTFEYQDIDGDYYEAKLTDYEAIVVQHEMDHLKGILFYDHINADAPWEADDDTTVL